MTTDLPSQLSRTINKAANTHISGRTSFLDTMEQLAHDIADVLALHLKQFDRDRFIADCDVPENGDQN